MSIKTESERDYDYCLRAFEAFCGAFAANICDSRGASAHGQSEQSTVAAENTVWLAASWSSDDSGLVPVPFIC